MLTSNTRDAEMNANIEGKFGVTRTSRLRVGAVWCAAVASSGGPGMIRTAVGVTFHINLQWS